jgi:hypothetical protein
MFLIYIIFNLWLVFWDVTPLSMEEYVYLAMNLKMSQQLKRVKPLSQEEPKGREA